MDAAQNERQQMQQFMQNEELKIPMNPYSPAIDAARCAEEMLSGFMALKQKDVAQAVAHFTKAVQQEEAMVYNEPRDWLLNPNPYLGIAYLMAKQYDKAEKAFRKDLSINDQNVWALRGLHQALQKQGKHAQAATVLQQLNKAAVKSDVDYDALFFTNPMAFSKR